MTDALTKLKDDLTLLTDALIELDFFKTDKVLIIGASTSEIMGKEIGSSSSEAVAEVLFNHFYEVATATGVHLAFQGCEHINRAITTTAVLQTQLDLTAVTVVPHRNAGGSLSEWAYTHLENPIVVEAITADIGIDIGQTLIGMHLREVAVPIRTKVRTIGDANVTIATTRPKLIGGPRAHY